MPFVKVGLLAMTRWQYHDAMNIETDVPSDDPLLAAVRRNCLISDARHARNMTLCNYLLEMRGLYCWEKNLPLSEPPSRAAVGPWLATREAVWNELDDSGAEYESIPIDAEMLDPFAVGEINQSLFRKGMVYGAGIGRFKKPHFFLGELLRRENRGAVEVVISGQEYVRDLNALPAALQGSTIYLRRDALRRWLWEKAEEWELRKNEGPLKITLDRYGYAEDPLRAIDAMAEAETETLILHELGEHAAGQLLGPGWEDMLNSFAGRRAEVLARAVRDNLADCLSTLPTLLATDKPTSVHFWFANFDGMRAALFPSLTAAYGGWSASGDTSRLQAAVADGHVQWSALALRLLEFFRRDNASAESRIEALAEEFERLAL